MEAARVPDGERPVDVRVLGLLEELIFLRAFVHDQAKLGRMVVLLVGATPASPLARTRATQASPLQERRYIASRVARSDSITFPHHVATPRDGIDARLLAAAAQPLLERVARAAAAPLP